MQDVPIEELTRLDENDILFIDSTHVLKIGSDVHYLYLDVLLRLKKGVIIHIHDVFIPEEYPRDWVVRDHKFWNEQYLLQAFLAFNDSFEILWASNYMAIRYPELRADEINSFNRNEKHGSIWIRRSK